MILLLALIEKRIFSLYIILLQDSFMFLCSLLISVDKISCFMAWGRSLLRACKQLLHPRDMQVIILLVYMFIFMWL